MVQVRSGSGRTIIDQYGLHFNDSHGLTWIGQAKKIMNEILGNKQADPSLAGMQSVIRKDAEFLVRLLVVLQSERMPNNFSQPLSADEIENIRNNKMRINRLKRLPNIRPRPIKIDITEPVRKALETGKPKQIRELLGKTLVAQSRWIFARKGVPLKKPYRMPEHERRIPANEDRTKARRELFARRAVEIELIDGRPVQVRHDVGGAQDAPKKDA